MIPDASKGEFKDINYEDKDTSLKAIKTWISKNMPNYSKKLKNPKQFESFNKPQEKLNTVYLFNDKVPTVWKALSATYYNTIRFAHLDPDDAPDAVDLFESDHTPSIHVA